MRRNAPPPNAAFVALRSRILQRTHLSTAVRTTDAAPGESSKRNIIFGGLYECGCEKLDA